MELTNRQNEIIDKAVDLIAICGIQHMTMKNLAKSVGVTEPAIYRHFENKFAILDAILDRFTYISSDVLNSEEMDKQSPLDKIGYFLMDRYQRCSENPKLAKVMFSEEVFQDDERLAQKVLMIMHSHKETMHQVITAGQQDCSIRHDIDPTSLFRIIFGPMRLLIKQWCLSGYIFDLVAEGKALWETEKKLISKELVAPISS